MVVQVVVAAIAVLTKTVLIKDLTVRGRCVGCVAPSITPQNPTEPRLAG